MFGLQVPVPAFAHQSMLIDVWYAGVIDKQPYGGGS